MNMIHDYSLKVTYDQLAVANSIISTTKVQNKDYAEVNQRIKAFRFLYPQGFITTNVESIQDGVCVMTARVGYYEDGKPVILGTGTAYEKENSSFINKTSYIENCETSAVGRALGMAGIGIDISVASAEEVQNAILNQEGDKEATKTEKQSLMAILKSMNLDYKEVLGAVGWKEGDNLTKKQYVQVLANLRQ